MSGHSKWHSIKHKKGAIDAKRGKIFTKHAKLIAIAARDGGGDPSMNPTLRTAIVNAKADNLPNTNIEKAIKKGEGGDKEGMNYSEVMYEGFGPCGTALFVHVITDNKNRSVGNVKNIFAKNGGNMGEAGSVGWMFEKKGQIFTNLKNKNRDDAELEIIDSGAEDISIEGENVEVKTSFADLSTVRENLEKMGYETEKAEVSFFPKNYVKIDNLEDAKKIVKLIDALEEDDDVTNVYCNFDVPDEVMEQI
jgi:YebC/PmpR family DNA-binding regulatory protein